MSCALPFLISLIPTSVQSWGQLRLSTTTAHAASSWPNPIASDMNTTFITMANAVLPKATSLSSETPQLLFFFHHPKQPSNEKKMQRLFQHVNPQSAQAQNCCCSFSSSFSSSMQWRWTLNFFLNNFFFFSLDLLLLVSSKKEDWRIRRDTSWGACFLGFGRPFAFRRKD